MTQQAINDGIVLYELDIDRKQVEESQRILNLVPELIEILKSPVIARKKKNNIIDNIFFSAGCSKKLAEFVKVMCKYDEIHEINDIYTAYYDYWDEKNNRKRVKCIFAKQANLEEIEEIKTFLQKKYPGKELVIESCVDPDILGGAIIQVGHEEYDWSFEDKIKQLEYIMKDAVVF